MSDEDKEDKQFEASQKRLEDLRRQGRIARSQDLTQAAALAGLLLAMIMAGGWTLDRAGSVLATLLAQADPLSRALSQGARASLLAVLPPLLLALAPLVLLPLAGVLLGVTVQRAWLFTPDNLRPRLSRISPLASAAQKFGAAGLIGFGKSCAKLVLVSLVLGWFLWSALGAMIGTTGAPATVAIGRMFQDLLGFLQHVLAVAVLVAAADYLWQILHHRRTSRMSRQDMQDEHKEAEGDPHAKSHRKERGKEIAMNRMLQDVPAANVVIVNPTHYAVALRWNRASGRAPVCVAKGMDEVATRIRERAMLAGVPIHSDPPTARALHATMQVGEEIPKDHYKAVAAAIRFAEAMRRKARRGQR